MHALILHLLVADSLMDGRETRSKLVTERKTEHTQRSYSSRGQSRKFSAKNAMPNQKEACTEWDSLRTKLKSLYMEQAQTLERMMKYMKDAHGFSAT